MNRPKLSKKQLAIFSSVTLLAFQGITSQAQITPPDKAVAGDYVATLRATARAETASSDFRIAVTTSTLWGIVAVGIIGVALLIMVGAVARFGRR